MTVPDWFAGIVASYQADMSAALGSTAAAAVLLGSAVWVARRVWGLLQWF